MLRNNKEICHAELFQVVVQKKKTRIIACCQTRTLGSKRTVEDLFAEYGLLAFQFIFFPASEA